MTDDDRENALRAFAREDDIHNELMKASLDSAREAMRAMLLLNGGASIALLGFLASTFSAEFTVDESLLYNSILHSLTYFAGGALLAVFTSALAYIVNSLYAGATAHKQRKWEWPYIERTPASRRIWFWGQVLNWVAVATGAASWSRLHSALAA